MSSVSLTIKNNIAIVTLQNETKLNALTMAMLDALNGHLETLEADDKICGLILTGTGPKAFCCGADIGEWSQLSPKDFARYWVRRGHRIFDRLARLHLPTIAALNGHAFGGGLELASACDMRIMTASATLALPEAQIGVVPGWSGSQRLTRLMPEPVVKEMVLFGRRVGAERALNVGFVTEIVEDVLSTAMNVMGGLAALSPRSIEVAKAMVHVAGGEDRAATTEALGGAAIAASDDLKEGVQAFRDKRQAAFCGR